MSIIDAVKNLSFKMDYSSTMDQDEKLAFEAALNFLNSDEANAESLCKQLLSKSNHEDIKSIANNILYAIYLWNNQMDKLTDLGYPKTLDEEEAMRIYNEDNVEYVFGEECCNIMLDYIPGFQPWKL